MGEWHSWWNPEGEKVELKELSRGDEDYDAQHPLSGCNTFEEIRHRMAEWEQEFPDYELAFDYKTASFGYGAREMRWVLVGFKK